MVHADDRRDPGQATEPVGAGSAHVHASAATGHPVSEQGAPGSTRSGSPPIDVVARAKALMQWWKESRPGRALAHFGVSGGRVFSGGIAYSALFSVVAGLTIGFTVFMAVLGGNEQLRQDVIENVAEALPGLIDTGDGDGLLSPEVFVISPGVSIAGAVAVVVLLLSALAVMAALRMAIRAMFSDIDASGAVAKKLRELAGFAALSLAVVVSAVLGIVVSSAAQWTLALVGLSGTSPLVAQGIGILIAFVVDASVFMLLVVLLAGQRPPRRDLLIGAAMAGAALGVVRYLGTSVVTGSVQGNPVLGSFAVIVVLLLWINLIARIVLMAAAWTADPPLVEKPGQGGDEPSAER